MAHKGETGSQMARSRGASHPDEGWTQWDSLMKQRVRKMSCTLFMLCANQHESFDGLSDCTQRCLCTNIYIYIYISIITSPLHDIQQLRHYFFKFSEAQSFQNYRYLRTVLNSPRWEIFPRFSRTFSIARVSEPSNENSSSFQRSHLTKNLCLRA